MVIKMVSQNIKIAEQTKRIAGVVSHTIIEDEHPTLRGYASVSEKVIGAPVGNTSGELYIIAHECAHVLMNHSGKTFFNEIEAVQWAKNMLLEFNRVLPEEPDVAHMRYFLSMFYRDCLRSTLLEQIRLHLALTKYLLFRLDYCKYQRQYNYT